MRYVKYLGLVLIALALAACSSSKNRYANAGSVVPVKVPPGATSPTQHGYYLAPSVSRATKGKTKVSMLPPGSKIAKYSKAKKSKAKKIRSAARRAILTKDGQEVVLSMSERKAWSKVGRALAATKYRILDKDKALETFYVLDTVSTGNKITEQTPIYRVEIKQAGNKSLLILRNRKEKPVDAKITRRVLTAIQQKLA